MAARTMSRRGRSAGYVDPETGYFVFTQLAHFSGVPASHVVGIAPSNTSRRNGMREGFIHQQV